MFVAIPVGRNAGAGSRVVADRGPHDFIVIPHSPAARVRAGFGIVGGSSAVAAIRSVDTARSTVHSCVRVIPGGRAVSVRIGVVVRVARVIAVIRRVIPAATIDRYAKADMHSIVATGVAGRDSQIVTFFYFHVGHVVGRRRRWNRVDYAGYLVGDDPWTIGNG